MNITNTLKNVNVLHIMRFMSKLKKLIMMANASSDDSQSSKYLTIEALEDNLTVSLSRNSCQYSLNGTDWTYLSKNTASPAINTGEKIYFKKASELTIFSTMGIGTFTISKPFNLSGNCMSMLFGDYAKSRNLIGYRDCFIKLFYNTPVVNVSSNFLPATILDSNCYQQMFYNCTSLTTAPELPATELIDYCYQHMFSGCTSLVSAPELPATELAEYCYQYMFAYCSSLVNISSLHATTLANYCYNHMFDECTSLINAPELPATILAQDCYSSMFWNCTSLTVAPELPATTLAPYCYSDMFAFCTSLVTAPELPATTLAQSCYSNMFYMCTSLNYIKILAIDITGSGLYIYSVSPTGTFVKSKDAIWDESNIIPEGWTVEYI